MKGTHTPEAFDDGDQGSNIELEKFFEAVQGFFFKVIYNINTQEYSFPFVSKKAETVYGLSIDELQKNGSDAFQSIFGEDKDIMVKAAAESMRTMSLWKQEFRFQRVSGPIGWMCMNAKPEKVSDHLVAWNGYLEDITAAKNTALELLDIKNRFEFAIDGSEMGVWDWNVKENSVFYSDKSLEFLGKTRDQIIPNDDTWTRQVHPDDKQKYFDDIKGHFEGNTPYYSNQHRIFTASGEYIWIQDRGKIVAWDNDGNPIRVIGTHVDITKMKEHEQTIVQKNSLIQNHNNRLKNFALIVSHNLRTHAGNLKNILELIEKARSPEEKKELSSYLKLISTGLSGTINNLDDVVSSNSNLGDTPKLIFVREFVATALKNLRKQISEKQVHIDIDIPSDIQITYNTAYLESILFNLISNAIKYSDTTRESKVTISAEIISSSDLVVSVADNGLGINLEKYGDKLFGMYNTFHRNEDAKGIGLFMTKNQVEDMGDEIHVTSVLGEGSTFSVHFKNKLP